MHRMGDIVEGTEEENQPHLSFPSPVQITII